MVLFYSGPEKPEKVARMAERYFSGHAEGKPRNIVGADLKEPIPASAPFDEIREIGTHQAHTILGTRISDMYSPKRYAMSLLTNILGGPGMNSQLNVALRERRGLVYTVDASTALLSDTGLFTIYYGCDAEDVERCRRIATDIIERQAEHILSARQLEDAKRQYIGQLTVASTNTEQRALNMARSTLFRGHTISPQEHLDAIRALSPSDIITAASTLIPLSRLTLI